MQQIIPYQQNANSKKNEMSIKAMVGYTLLTVVALGGSIYLVNRLIKTKIANKSDAKSFQDGTPQTVAKQIKMALENKADIGPNSKALRQILISMKSKDELNKVRIEYDKMYKGPMFNDIKKEVKDTEYNEFISINETKPEKAGGKVANATLYKAWSKRLKAAFDRKYTIFGGTDEEAIKAVFYEVPTQQAFVEVGKVYMKDYHANVITVLKSELTSSEYPVMMSIITKKRKN